MNRYLRFTECFDEEDRGIINDMIFIANNSRWNLEMSHHLNKGQVETFVNTARVINTRLPHYLDQMCSEGGKTNRNWMLYNNGYKVNTPLVTTAIVSMISSWENYVI